MLLQFLIKLTGMAVTVVGTVGCFRGPRSWRWALLWTLLLWTGPAIVISSSSGSRGGTGYPTVEVVATFRDTSGRPVPGVELSVEDTRGFAIYLYPVDDFAPDSKPTSDAGGVLRFHHVIHTPEFDISSYDILGMSVQGSAAPKYWCRFMRHGEIVAKIRYGEWDERGRKENALTIRRHWTDPAMPHNLRWAEEFNVSGAPPELQGVREVRAAQYNVSGRWYKLAETARTNRSNDDEIDFQVVELSFVVPD